MTGHVRAEASSGVLALTVTRPQEMNALKGAMYSALADGLARGGRPCDQRQSCAAQAILGDARD